MGERTRSSAGEVGGSRRHQALVAARGREILARVETGDVDELGFPIWFEPYQSYGNAGDLTWTTAWPELASHPSSTC